MFRRLWNKLWEGWYPEPEVVPPFTQGYRAWREDRVHEEFNPFVPGSVPDFEFSQGWRAAESWARKADQAEE